MSTIINGDRERWGFDDVKPEAAERLVAEWGYDETSETYGAMLGWATGLLHDGSDDDE